MRVRARARPLPLALVAAGVRREFKPHARAGDVVAGVLGHLCCAALGGTTAAVLAAASRWAARAR